MPRLSPHSAWAGISCTVTTITRIQPVFKLFLATSPPSHPRFLPQPRASPSMTHNATSTHLWLCWVRYWGSGGESLQEVWCLRSVSLTLGSQGLCFLNSQEQFWMRAISTQNQVQLFSAAASHPHFAALHCSLAAGCWQHQDNALRAKKVNAQGWDWGRGLFCAWHNWDF